MIDVENEITSEQDVTISVGILLNGALWYKLAAAGSNVHRQLSPNLEWKGHSFLNFF